MTLSHEMTLTSDLAVVVNNVFYTNIIKKEHAPDAPVWGLKKIISNACTSDIFVSGLIGSGGPPYFSANTLKSPLNWLKFTKKILGQAPEIPDCLIIVTTIDRVALRTSSIAIISFFFLALPSLSAMFFVCLVSRPCSQAARAFRQI